MVTGFSICFCAHSSAVKPILGCYKCCPQNWTKSILPCGTIMYTANKPPHMNKQQIDYLLDDFRTLIIEKALEIIVKEAEHGSNFLSKKPDHSSITKAIDERQKFLAGLFYDAMQQDPTTIRLK